MQESNQKISCFGKQHNLNQNASRPVVQWIPLGTSTFAPPKSARDMYCIWRWRQNDDRIIYCSRRPNLTCNDQNFIFSATKKYIKCTKHFKKYRERKYVMSKKYKKYHIFQKSTKQKHKTYFKIEIRNISKKYKKMIQHTKRIY